MSFCANCGGKLVAGARFCNGCGNPVQAPVCYQCEKPIVGKVLNVGTPPPHASLSLACCAWEASELVGAFTVTCVALVRCST
jgi:predicted amidophosphoribosyltransferase